MKSRSGIDLQPSASDVAVQPHSSSCTFPGSSLAHGPDHVVSNPYPVQQSGDYAMVGAFSNALHDTLNRPNLELFKFSGTGDATACTRFIGTLEATIEVKERDNRLRLLYLIQNCEGKAKSLIQYCVLLDPDVGYDKSKQILYENFRRKPLIARLILQTSLKVVLLSTMILIL